MRPIRLTVKGLHSFREKQTVDFSMICSGGVFGIFGPTGSGKSSLLDAMTLALYGKVERALNNTQGIMNHSENTLSVSLTFELGPQKNAARYTVERTFKRSSEHNVQTSVCRLLDSTGDPVVIADKKQEVDKYIESLLGLSIDDFTRAVVLPQGKFSEFLHLRGNERKKMLQRLFRLEKYGDQLLNNIKLKLREADHEKDRLAAEQHGMGDTSENAYKRVKEACNYWAERLKEYQHKKKKIEEEWEQTRQLWTWQQEKIDAENHLNYHLKKDDQIEEYKTFLAQSDMAAKVKPLADSLITNRDELEKWEKTLVAAQTNYEQSVQEYNSLSQEMEQLKEEKEQAMNVLHETEKSVEQAQKVKREKQEYRQQRDVARDDLNKIEQEIDKWNASLEKEESNVKKYKHAVEQFHAQYNHMYVSSEEKHRLIKAKEEKQHLRYLETNIDKRKEECKKRQSELEAEKTKLREAEEKCKKTEKNVQNRFNQVFNWYEEAAELNRWLEGLYSHVEKTLEAEREREKKRQLDEMAAVLSKSLKEGTSCPVCGSPSHPYPAEHFSEAAAASEDNQTHQKTLEYWLTVLQKTQFSTKEKMLELEQMSQHITSYLDKTDKVITNDNIDRTSPEREVDITEDSWQETLNHTLNKWKKEEETISKLSQLVNDDIDAYRKADEQKQRYNYQVEDLTVHYERLRQETAEEEANFQRELENWKMQFPSFTYDTLDAEYDKVRDREQQCETFKRRAEEGQRHIYQLEQQCEETKTVLQTKTVQHAECHTKYKQFSTLVKEKEGELERLLGQKDIQVLIDWMHTERSKWQNKEKEIAKRAERAEEATKKWENEKNIATHTCQDAKSRYELSLSKWLESKKKENHFFTNPEEVHAYILTENEYIDYRQQIDDHEKEKEKWRNLLENVSIKLNGRRVEEKDWQACEVKKKEINEEIDNIREKRGAALEQLNDLNNKRDRYQELEKQREKWADTAEKYQKLYQVFRGKNFIEFLAEEQLIQISQLASERLRDLTRGRYALEVDSNSGFVIRDDTNGGIRRPVSSLSGGETFLTSLALALSLSASIQLKGEYPLEFFFLDEGFGTLDQDLLETVISSLEKLQTHSLSVGIISHVPELQERIARKIEVIPAQPGGEGSRITVHGVQN
ncbi:AAA family ATPase [Alteribacillus iranensis]|uniref:Nuclease SbcCD subunit C n=1 Tax=Alteribacillus iranensis TaxID=930128 RepID=A0A1I1ZWE0_9BACI|nr:SMC family ATPase [Alteribacillus iranensis]SFE35952.1 exonuclease SbcC [Alteribacillus iranensis]